MSNFIKSYNEDTIRALAYQRWIDDGKPDGCAEIHWQWALASLTASVERPLALVAAVATGDDVALIDGIGPKITSLLAKEGITKISQIAKMTDKALGILDAKLGLKGRSLREEWIAQAKELLAGMAPRAKTDQAKAAKTK